MTISPRDKNYLIAGGVAVFVTVFYYYAITPLYQGYLDTKAEIASKHKLLAQYQALWEKRGEVEKKLKDFQSQSQKFQEMLLQEKNESLAAAELQKTLEGLSSQSGVDISSSKVMGSRKAGTFEEITIQLGVKSSLKNLQKFFYLLENSKKYLSLSEMTLRVLNFNQTEQLDAKMKISGYLKAQ